MMPNSRGNDETFSESKYICSINNPYNADYGFGWHRDFGKNERDSTEEVELEILNRPMTRLK
jgi:hypothetical protein